MIDSPLSYNNLHSDTMQAFACDVSVYKHFLTANTTTKITNQKC